MREKICQYLNFGKIFYLGTFCAQTCLQEASKKGTRVGFEIRTKKWPKSQKIQIFTILTPPTLAKSATKLDSIKKLTKGLFLISPIPGRMQKFREIVCADREKGIRIFSGFIYVTTTRTGQGPYPALNDNECTNSDHLVVFSGPWGPRLPCQEFGLWSGVPPVMRRIFIISKVCYDFYLAVPFGHWQLAMLQVFFSSDCSSRMWKTGGTSVKPLAACEGMLWGKPHITCPQKIFEKIRSSKIEKF